MSYWNKYGLAPFGENEILNAAIYYRLKGDDYTWNQIAVETIINTHLINDKILYPPNPKEGWSHDNNLGLVSLRNQFSINSKNATKATFLQRVAYNMYNLPILWILLGVITCLRSWEKDHAGNKMPRTSGIRLLWLRCQITNSRRIQKIYQRLLENHPCKSFEGVLQYYYKNDINHPIVLLSNKADL